MNSSALFANYFRHEYGRTVAILANRVGLRHLQAIEDAVQSALLSALEVWSASGQPDNPSAWIYQVAKNNVLEELRKHDRYAQLLDQIPVEYLHQHASAPDAALSDDITDELLRMLFACCDGAISTESQLVLALKTLCGFSVSEIAPRLFTTEEAIYKRLKRALTRLREKKVDSRALDNGNISARLSSVQKILYLMFTEGYLSVTGDFSIRRDLCNEAIRLTSLLANHSFGSTPKTCALLALMHLHRARVGARHDGSGGLLLLEEQDRKQWDQSEIGIGISWLEESACGDEFSRFHAEAGIAAEHCISISYTTTNWQRIIECYELLEASMQSPIHTLNRAVALAELNGPEAGLALLQDINPPPWLQNSFLWVAVMADLQTRCGNAKVAKQYCTEALENAPSTAIKAMLQRRFTGS
ncbi:sigma-70 family RNA polymerase sigma factor [Granulosicoccus sp.]|nr:sigma-70 family RNA polymerase sigma factor [Granulosicoccus sp.]